MPYRYNVKIDFVGDWRQRLRKELQERGYNTKNIKDKDVSFAYFNLKLRQIEATPRKVLISKEFQCPKELEYGLQLLKNKIETGKDITGNLSKKILELNYHDDLLNDWGIHHLHLGIDISKKNGFVERTEPLLFARFDNDNAYLINTYKHGEWTKQEMIKILHNNWPESIKQFKMNDIEGLEFKPSDADYKKLRKSHISTLVEVDKNVVYFPIGMGYASSGHSTEAIRASDYYFKVIRNYEKCVKDNILQIAKSLAEKGVDLGYNLSFHLWLENNRVIAYEQYTNSFIDLGPLNN